MSNDYERPLPLPDALVDEFQYDGRLILGDGLVYYRHCEFCIALGAEECVGHPVTIKEVVMMEVEDD